MIRYDCIFPNESSPKHLHNVLLFLKKIKSDIIFKKAKANHGLSNYPFYTDVNFWAGRGYRGSTFNSLSLVWQHWVAIKCHIQRGSCWYLSTAIHIRIACQSPAVLKSTPLVTSDECYLQLTTDFSWILAMSDSDERGMDISSFTLRFNSGDRRRMSIFSVMTFGRWTNI